MPIALLLLAGCLVAGVALGPLGLGWLDWRTSASGLNQLYGASAVEVLLVAPVVLAAAWLWRRRHRLAPVLALGAAPYSLYVAVQDVLFPDYHRYAGNNERFFPLFLALMILSWAVTARAWGALDPSPPAPSRGLARTAAAVLLVLNVVMGFAWSAQVLPIALTGALPAGYADDTTGFWLIRLVDLGVIIPLSLATGVGLWRGLPAAIRAAYALLSFLTLELAAVLAMGVVMLWRQDPSATPGLVFVLAPIFLVLAVVTLRLLGSYAGGSPAGRNPARPAGTPPQRLSRIGGPR